MAPIEWPEIAPTVTSGRAIRARNAAAASRPNSPALSGSASGGFAPWPRTSNVRQWKPGGVQEDRHRQRPVARRFPAVDEHDARAGCSVPGRDEPGRQRRAVRGDADRLERQAEIGRRDPRRVATRVAGTHAIREGEAIGEPDLRGGHGGRDPDPTPDPHTGRGRHPGSPCQVPDGAPGPCVPLALHSRDGQT